jgi:16S rRNA G527 N7-methylase RsmG
LTPSIVPPEVPPFPTPFFGKSELARLEEISEAIGRSPRPGFVASCEAFLGELVKWNRRINLVSRLDEERIVERHLLDSLCLLSVEPQLAGKTAIDVGSGAGFPGLVLALWEPAASVFLVESRGKRASFLRTAKRRLFIRNIKVMEARLEQLAEALGADVSETALGSDDSLRSDGRAWGVRASPRRGEDEHSLVASGVDVIVSRGVGNVAGLLDSAEKVLGAGGLFVVYGSETSGKKLTEGDLLRESKFEAELVAPAWSTPTRLLVLRKLP